jgi:hypothetical protein
VTADPVRASRFELVDRAGNVRAVLGQVGSGAGTGDTYGLSLLDPDGAERVTLTLDAHGPTIVFVQAGNVALQLGVDDAVLPGDNAGAFVTIAAEDGRPLLRLRAVPPHGPLVLEGGP